MIERLIKHDLRRKFKKSKSFSQKREIVKGLRILEYKNLLFPGFIPSLNVANSIYDSNLRQKEYKNYLKLKDDLYSQSKRARVQFLSIKLLEMADHYKLQRETGFREKSI